MIEPQIKFKPKNELENFGFKIYNLLVENFSETFFVGGMVRDLVLEKKITDLDIATSATPKEVIKLVQSSGFKYDDNNSKFGVVSAVEGENSVEIATLRQDIYKKNRYPKVRFILDKKLDSQRRDFTINALYLSGKTGELWDFYEGLLDIKKRTLRFIGNPAERIQEDPLRIVRAIRFCIALGFKFEKNTKEGILGNFKQTLKLTPYRIAAEESKLKNREQKKLFHKLLGNSQELDKVF